jgi:cytochrome b561
MTMVLRDGSATATHYRPAARFLHWLVAGLIIVQLTTGVIMVYEGAENSIWERLTNSLRLWDVHKLLGLVVLAVLLIRLGYRVTRGTPPDEPTLETWQREASHMVHAWIYFLLILIPVLGWLGISLYPALVVFDHISIPALMEPDRSTSKAVLTAHVIAVVMLVALLAVHITAALFHYYIRHDGVLQRMLPGLRRRTR